MSNLLFYLFARVSAPLNHINVIASSSRGKAVVPFFNTAYANQTRSHFICKPGGKLSDLSITALDFCHTYLGIKLKIPPFWQI